MNKYKWLNAEQTSVLEYPVKRIVEDGAGWRSFQEYLAAEGQVDPWKTPEELSEYILTEKLIELKAERDLRVDALTGTSDPRKMINMLMKAVRTINRKVDSDPAIPQADLDSLTASDSLVEAIDIIDNAHDTAEAWLEDPARTDTERSTFDVVNTPNWSGV